MDSKPGGYGVGAKGEKFIAKAKKNHEVTQVGDAGAGGIWQRYGQSLSAAVIPLPEAQQHDTCDIVNSCRDWHACAQESMGFSGEGRKRMTRPCDLSFH